MADKLDIKPGSRVLVLGVDDPDFWRELRQRTGNVWTETSAVDADLIFLQVEEEQGLAVLEEIQPSLKRRGAIWIVSPRGSKELNELTIMQAGRSAGLVDVKVARFSSTHTALKFVIPVAKR